MTEQRAEIAPDEASDAGVLSPVKADNEVWHGLCRCESVISIRYSYQPARRFFSASRPESHWAMPSARTSGSVELASTVSV